MSTAVQQDVRGYAAIALINPKDGYNVGGTMRSVGCFGADLVMLEGKRANGLLRHSTDTMNAWKHIPVQWTQDVFETMPYACVPVAVDLVPDAIPSPGFVHPERACYIFGAEDATLGAKYLDRCKYRLVLPTRQCLNLSVAVACTLLDRVTKRGVPFDPAVFAR